MASILTYVPPTLWDELKTEDFDPFILKDALFCKEFFTTSFFFKYYKLDYNYFTILNCIDETVMLYLETVQDWLASGDRKKRKCYFYRPFVEKSSDSVALFQLQAKDPDYHIETRYLTSDKKYKDYLPIKHVFQPEPQNIQTVVVTVPQLVKKIESEDLPTLNDELAPQDLQIFIPVEIANITLKQDAIETITDAEFEDKGGLKIYNVVDTIIEQMDICKNVDHELSFEDQKMFEPVDDYEMFKDSIVLVDQFDKKFNDNPEVEQFIDNFNNKNITLDFSTLNNAVKVTGGIQIDNGFKNTYLAKQIKTANDQLYIMGINKKWSNGKFAWFYKNGKLSRHLRGDTILDHSDFKFNSDVRVKLEHDSVIMCNKNFSHFELVTRVGDYVLGFAPFHFTIVDLKKMVNFNQEIGNLQHFLSILANEKSFYITSCYSLLIHLVEKLIEVPNNTISDYLRMISYDAASILMLIENFYQFAHHFYSLPPIGKMQINKLNISFSLLTKKYDRGDAVAWDKDYGFKFKNDDKKYDDKSVISNIYGQRLSWRKVQKDNLVIYRCYLVERNELVRNGFIKGTVAMNVYYDKLMFKSFDEFGNCGLVGKDPKRIDNKNVVVPTINMNSLR